MTFTADSPHVLENSQPGDLKAPDLEAGADANYGQVIAVVCHACRCYTDYHQAWDGPMDDANPRNRSNRQKWIDVLLISVQGTLSPIASTILAIGALDIASDFSLVDSYTPTLPVGLYVLGLGVGPLFLTHCSELYGRRVVYIGCFTVFAILNVGCALSLNIVALSVVHLLSGMAGSAGPSLGGSSIDDMFRSKKEERPRQHIVSVPPAGL